MTNPVKPPIRNWKINAMAYSIGGFTSIEPLYMVATQLNTFTAEGMATRNVRMEKTIRAGPLMPEVNI